LATDVGDDAVFALGMGETDRLGDLLEQVDDRSAVEAESLRVDQLFQGELTRQ